MIRFNFFAVAALPEHSFVLTALAVLTKPYSFIYFTALLIFDIQDYSLSEKSEFESVRFGL